MLTKEQRLAIHRPIAEMAIAMNIEQSRDQTEMVVRSMFTSGWDIQRIMGAARYALSSRDALREIKFSGAITPLVLMEAEKAREESQNPVVGQCFTPYCNREARKMAWGEVYCRPCYDMHIEKIRVRRSRYDASKQERGALMESRAKHIALLDELSRSKR